MKQQIASIALVVPDYDLAIEYYTNVLGFELLEDTHLGPDKRWVRVQPAGGIGPSLILAQAANDKQIAAVGNQTGGRVFLFLHTDDIRRDYRAYQDRGVRFEDAPRIETYGLVAVFEDILGNRWDLIQPRKEVT